MGNDNKFSLYFWVFDYGTTSAEDWIYWGLFMYSPLHFEGVEVYGLIFDRIFLQYGMYDSEEWYSKWYLFSSLLIFFFFYSFGLRILSIEFWDLTGIGNYKLTHFLGISLWILFMFLCLNCGSMIYFFNLNFRTSGFWVLSVSIIFFSILVINGFWILMLNGGSNATIQHWIERAPINLPMADLCHADQALQNALLCKVCTSRTVD